MSRWSLNAERRTPETPVVLSLGSNLGAREEHVLAGASALAGLDGFELLALSSLYESSPIGISTDRVFINAACTARCRLTVREMLAATREIERRHGRGTANAFRDRTLDIDIILFGGEVILESDLLVPHPRFRERLFVLVPLMEICPDSLVPPDRLTIADVYRLCEGEGWVRRVSGRVDRSNFLKTK